MNYLNYFNILGIPQRDKLKVKGKGKEEKDLIITFYINEKL